MTNLLFVYGSLKSTALNKHSQRLAQDATLIEHAYAKGDLYDLGNYPGMVLGSGRVQGELWRLQSLEKTLRWLDEYEGVSGSECDEYMRVKDLVFTSQNVTHIAWLYRYQGAIHADSVLADGIWNKI